MKQTFEKLKVSTAFGVQSRALDDIQIHLSNYNYADVEETILKSLVQKHFRLLYGGTETGRLSSNPELMRPRTLYYQLNCARDNDGRMTRAVLVIPHAQRPPLEDAPDGRPIVRLQVKPPESLYFKTVRTYRVEELPLDCANFALAHQGYTVPVVTSKIRDFLAQHAATATGAASPATQSQPDTMNTSSLTSFTRGETNAETIANIEARIDVIDDLYRAGENSSSPNLQDLADLKVARASLEQQKANYVDQAVSDEAERVKRNAKAEKKARFLLNRAEAIAGGEGAAVVAAVFTFLDDEGVEPPADDRETDE